MDLATTISTTPLFAGLSREDLARIAGKLKEESFAVGETVFYQGDTGQSLYIIRSGAVEVIRESNGSDGESLAVLGPNECFGEITLFTGNPRSATARVVMNTVLVELDNETLNELLTKYSSISLHFCKILSERLVEADEYISRDNSAMRTVLEEFLVAQLPALRSVLLKTSILKKLDPGAMESCLGIGDASSVLKQLTATHTTFLHQDRAGAYEYTSYLRGYLYDKLGTEFGHEERRALHLRCAMYFRDKAKWIEALHHFISGEDWGAAFSILEEQSEYLLAHGSPEEVLNWADLVARRLPGTQERLQELRAESFVKLGQMGPAIQCYEDLIAQEQSNGSHHDAARHYESLAALHQMTGNQQKALYYLNQALTLMGEDPASAAPIQHVQSVSQLHQNRGSHEAALRWAQGGLKVARQLGATAQKPFLFRFGKPLSLLAALGIALGIAQIPETRNLTPTEIHFLATLAAAVFLWTVDVFDDYIVAIGLLLVWLLFGIASPGTALSGFSHSTWFFVLSVFGIGATITHSGLLYRGPLEFIRLLKPSYRAYTLILGTTGILVTPVLPTITARMAVIIPLAREVSDALGFKARSAGSAGITLAAYIGHSQITVMFLTGATVCLLGWSLLPEAARDEFRWITWLIAGLPAGLVVFFFLMGAILILFRPDQVDDPGAVQRQVKTQLQILGPLKPREWLCIGILILAIIGFVTQPFGIHEAWIAMGALFIFLITGTLDNKTLKQHVDWGYLIFLGIMTGMAAVITEIQLDQWIVAWVKPLLGEFVSPGMFLATVALLVYLARIFMRKTVVVILFVITLTPLAQAHGIHPGILLLTILLALEAWFLPYQAPSYQIAYYSTDGQTFSHAQARKLMTCKFAATFLAIAVSLPYWRWLGLIQ